MKMRSVAWFLPFLLAVLLSGCGNQIDQTPMATNQSVNRVFQNAVNNGFSGTVLVGQRGTVLLHEAAGFANEKSAIPNTVHTVFNIASITKQYTAALVIALQEVGKLSVDDKLSDHFENVPTDKENITLHQLLTHTSGLRRNFGGDTVAIERDIFLSLVWKTKLEFEPGTEYRYSNAGYSVLAAIVETSTGKSYEKLLQQYILAPAKLTGTGYVLPDWPDKAAAVGSIDKHAFEETRTWWADDGPYWNLRGNGGLLSTASDLFQWHKTLSLGQVLSDRSIELLHARHVNKTLGIDENVESEAEFYGYGWSMQDVPDVGAVHWHTGSSGRGFASFFGRAVDKDVVIVVLTNKPNEAAENLPDKLAEAIFQAK